jgi:hypothetical protein
MDLIALRPGTKLTQVVETFDRVARAAEDGNSWVSNHSQLEIVDHYLQWTEMAESQLRNVVDAEFASELVRTAGYWALRTTSRDAVRLNTLVREEYESRRRALEGLIVELRLEEKRWERKAAPLIVPDTTMFLDKQRQFHDVNWPELAEAKIEARLVVPLIVIHELDRLKRQGNSTTAQMAKAAIKWLSDALPSDVSSISDSFGPSEPKVTVEAYIHGGPARPEDADAVIIQFAGWVKATSCLPTKLVTRDLGMALRARSADVETVHVSPI